MKQPCLKKGGSHTQSPPFLRGIMGDLRGKKTRPRGGLLFPVPCSLFPVP
ncbi:hypothetical protein [Moorena producens]